MKFRIFKLFKHICIFLTISAILFSILIAIIKLMLIQIRPPRQLIIKDIGNKIGMKNYIN